LNIFRVIVGFVNCLLNRGLIKGDDRGATDQFIASVCQMTTVISPSLLLHYWQAFKGLSGWLTNRTTRMR